MPAVYPTGCPFESRFCDNAILAKVDLMIAERVDGTGMVAPDETLAMLAVSCPEIKGAGFAGQPSR